MGSIAQILPLSFVMIAGPQIISSFFLATSDNWRPTSAAYVGGAAISITAFVSLAYLFVKHVGGSLSTSDSSGGNTADYVILGLLAALMVTVFLKRKTSEPPAWMGKLQGATPGFAFKLGIALLGVFPTDIMTSFTVGTHLAHHGDPLSHALPFIGLTLLLLASPAIVLLLFGKRAEAFLPKARDWMNDNSWVVSEIVLLLFVGITASNL